MTDRNVLSIFVCEGRESSLIMVSFNGNWDLGAQTVSVRRISRNCGFCMTRWGKWFWVVVHRLYGTDRAHEIELRRFLHISRVRRRLGHEEVPIAMVESSWCSIEFRFLVHAWVLKTSILDDGGTGARIAYCHCQVSGESAPSCSWNDREYKISAARRWKLDASGGQTLCAQGDCTLENNAHEHHVFIET